MVWATDDDNDDDDEGDGDDDDDDHEQDDEIDDDTCLAGWGVGVCVGWVLGGVVVCWVVRCFGVVWWGGWSRLGGECRCGRSFRFCERRTFF